MNYILKNKEQEVLTFSVSPDGETRELSWAEKAAKPQALSHYGGLKPWLLSRSAPLTRANIVLCYEDSGIDTLAAYLDKTCALSLNDAYWVVPEGDRRQYRDLSPYRGYGNKRISELALWGRSGLEPSPAPSPEFTTGGTRPKCWEKGLGGRMHLIKRASSSGTREPYSDYYATQLLQVLGVDRYAHCELVLRGGEVCSASRIFTDELLGFLSAEDLGLGEDLAKLEEYYRTYHQFRFLRKMFLFDALVLNPSRTPDKFGFQTVNGRSGVIWGAPVFGNGDALLSKTPAETLGDGQKLWDYAESLSPKLGDGFIKTARYYSSERDLELLEALSRDFAFRPHPEYNLPASMLESLSGLVRTQAKRILQSK